MNNILTLNNPPFTPADDQVIYLEWQENEGINAFIKKNYEWMKELFLSYGLNFCYLPMLGRDVIKYNAPHLTDEECDKILETIPSLQDYVVKDEEIHGPVLAFSVENEDSDVPDSFILHYVDIETKWYKPNKSIFKQLAKEIYTTRKDLKPYHCASEVSDEGLLFRDPEENVANEPATEYSGSDIRFSVREKADVEVVDDSSSNENHPTVRRSPNIEFSIVDSGVDGIEDIDGYTDSLVREIKERVKALRNCGVNTMFLHDIIDKEEPISRLVITKEYRIFLPDYNNTEIEMAALPKAVFLLYLRHPEGIRYKELRDYFDELLQIYIGLNPMGTTQKQRRSIWDVTNPLRNNINEKCARIREAFISKFDERLAKNYFITGKKGELKRITIDRNMVIWEQ